MAGLKSLKTFPFKSMLVILGVFLMIAVFLFAERSGIQYTEKNRKVAYLSQEEVVTEQMAAKSLPKTCRRPVWYFVTVKMRRVWLHGSSFNKFLKI